MKITVLMPIFATPVEWIRQAVESIIAQDHPEFQLLIVDDNNPKGAITDYIYGTSQLNCCINVIRTTENKGIAAALNTGLAHCKGDLIVRMDAGNYHCK